MYAALFPTLQAGRDESDSVDEAQAVQDAKVKAEIYIVDKGVCLNNDSMYDFAFGFLWL